MKRSFTRYWNKRWTGLEVGHRGSGPSFKPTSDDDAIRENTIASLRRAINAGADMVCDLFFFISNTNYQTF